MTLSSTQSPFKSDIRPPISISISIDVMLWRPNLVMDARVFRADRQILQCSFNGCHCIGWVVVALLPCQSRGLVIRSSYGRPLTLQNAYALHFTITITITITIDVPTIGWVWCLAELLVDDFPASFHIGQDFLRLERLDRERSPYAVRHAPDW